MLTFEKHHAVVCVGCMSTENQMGRIGSCMHQIDHKQVRYCIAMLVFAAKNVHLVTYQCARMIVTRWYFVILHPCPWLEIQYIQFIQYIGAFSSWSLIDSVVGKTKAHTGEKENAKHTCGFPSKTAIHEKLVLKHSCTMQITRNHTAMNLGLIPCILFNIIDVKIIAILGSFITSTYKVMNM